MEEFKDAVRERDAERVRALLVAHPQLRADIDRPDFEAAAPAIVFCRHDRAMVDVLLEFGADINVRSQFWGRAVGVLDDTTPEMRAYLIQRGAIPEIGDFIEAVHGRDAARLRSLLTASPVLRAHIDRPLFSFGAQAIVVAKNDQSVVETLLEFGANINVKTDWWAGGFGVLDDTEPRQAAWLIERGAIVDIHAAAGLAMADKVREWIAKDPSLVHAPGGDGKRPLHWASTTEIIDLLLAHGAEIDARCIDHRSTAAQYRVRDTQLCRHLISCGAEVDIFMAAALGDEGLVERAVNADPGCLAARIGRPGYAPVPPGHIYQWRLEAASVLLVAARHGGRKIYEFLLTRSPLKEQFLAACERADEALALGVLAERPDLVTELTADDRGQIVAAAFAHNIPALELMLKLGFDVNTRGGEGFTPVGHAALRGHVDTVRLLIAQGADLEIRNQYGGTALEGCQWGSLNFRDPSGDYGACVESLVQAGAKLTYPGFGSDAVQAVLRRYAVSSQRNCDPEMQ
ncbi:MAG TPA: ankyrin repeat domain-containing protein [Vicinamibacterales bacterium]|nr:ankyrin repeat domain-containing protein [Vicinamibacterales bacterium]